MVKRTFYPMLTSTLQSALSQLGPTSMHSCMQLIMKYPDIPPDIEDPFLRVIIAELDRQYQRWNKEYGA